MVADLDLCIGAGVCVMTAPKVFDQSAEDGQVRILIEEPTGEDAQLARVAVDHCPSAALTIEDEA